MTYSFLPGMTSKCVYSLKGQFDILYVGVLALLDRIRTKYCFDTQSL